MMKTCLLLSLVMLVQSKPGPKPKPEPKPKPGPKAKPKPFNSIFDPIWTSPCQPQLWKPPCKSQWPQPPHWPQPPQWPQPPHWPQPPQWPLPPQDKGCVCINPFIGQYNVQVNGDPDPDAMCRNRNMCYVDCNSMCRDVKNAKGLGRCYSKLACKGRRKGQYPGYPIIYRSTPYWGKK